MTAKLTVERVALELEASDVTVAEIAYEQVAENFRSCLEPAPGPRAS